MDADSAKRAAAAEARRQKILARGTERLNRITVGTPLLCSDTPVSTSSPGHAAPAAGSDDTSTRAGISGTLIAETSASASGHETPLVPVEAKESTVTAETRPSPPGSAAAATFAEGGPMLQQVLRGSSADAADPADASAMHAAHREAEQALHMLLNQLAGPAGADFLERLHGDASATCAAGDNGSDGGGGAGEGRLQAASASPAVGPSGRLGNGRAAVGVAGGGGAASGVLLALVTAVAAVAGVLLGPRLTAAVEATRLLRCVAAIALAAVLYGSVLEPEHLRLPPVVALLVMQAAVIAGARLIISPQGGARSAAGLSKSASAGGLASGDGGSGDGGSGGNGAEEGSGASAAKAPPTAPTRFDWATFVPGLRPLLDRLSSAGALVSGLFGDVAVYLVSYMVLDAWGKVAGPRQVE